MRRIFWLAVGLGAGATAAVMASRWMKRQSQKVAPANLARQARSGAGDLVTLVREALAAGREGMQEKESEIRSQLDGS